MNPSRPNPRTKPSRSIAAGRITAIALVTTLGLVPSLTAQTYTACRPGYPYRVWYGAPGFSSDPSLYTHMTIVNAGSASPQFVEEQGKAYLPWAFGTNINNTNLYQPHRQSKYWEERCTTARTWGPVAGFNYSLTTAGPGLDEWIGNSTYPDVYDWIQDGLAAGRTLSPDVFVGIWTVHTPAPQIYEMPADDTVDLIMVEGYDLAGPGLGISSNQAIARLEEFAQRGLERKSIMCLGHITDQVFNGQQWTEARLRARMEEIKRKFPESPGIGFFPGSPVNQADFDEIVRIADDLSAEYWPDLPLQDGLYSLTPQTGVSQRMDAAASGTSNGTKVVSWISKYPGSTTNQKWRFTHLGDNVYKIQPAYSTTLCLDVAGASNSNGAKVQLYTDNGTNAQKWRLSKTISGYRLSPLNAPTRFLQFASPANNTQAQIWTELTDDSQVFGVTPEVTPGDAVPPYYQAESATLGGGTTVSNTNPGSVGGYIGMPGSGGSATFGNVDGGSGGIKGIKIRYANGFTDNRPMSLTVNGSATTVQFPPTGSWQVWESLTLLRPLNAGSANTIVLAAAGVNTPGFDKITIIPPFYQAENAALAGGAYVSHTNPGSDGGYVGMAPTGSTMTWTSVEGGSGGNKALKFRYCNGFSDTRTVNLTINGTTTAIAFPPTGGWNKWHDISFFRPVFSGANNTITVTSSGTNTPGFDKLTISP